MFSEMDKGFKKYVEPDYTFHPYRTFYPRDKLPPQVMLPFDSKPEDRLGQAICKLLKY